MDRSRLQGAEPACVRSAHVGVHVPYEWHHCVATRGPSCSKAFPKFEPPAIARDVGRLSSRFIITASEIMHRGTCFAYRHYGNGSMPSSCAEPLLGTNNGDSGAVHWRVWAYQ